MPTKKKSSPRQVRPRAAAPDTMRSEYDFRDGVRGKYAGRFPGGGLVVTLDPDVAIAYPSATAVNAALRSLLETPGRSTRRKRTA